MAWPGSPAVFTVLPVALTSEEDQYLLRLAASIKHIRRKLLNLSQDALGERVKRDRNTILDALHNGWVSDGHHGRTTSE